MKKIIALMLMTAIMISLLTGCSEEVTIAGSRSISLTTSNNTFTFEMFKQLNEEGLEENIFISPLSMACALSMTLNGAENDTKADMKEALSYTGLTDDKINSGYRYLLTSLENLDDQVELNLANSIWVKKGCPVKEEFVKVNQDIFDAYVKELDFSQSNAPDQINGWIDKTTKGMIPKMINSIPGDVIMYLINAIYFKGEWTHEFNENNTYDTIFTGLNSEEIDIEMMSRTDEIDYMANDRFKAVRLGYGDEKVSMYCILPKEGEDINALISEFDVAMWDDLKSQLSGRNEVILKIPKFKMEYGIKELNDSLSALGMGSAFGEGADFSGIADNVFISRVLHKAVIEVDEKGTEAAAVTVVEIEETAVVEPAEKPVTFIADRPFMFVIADDVEGNILFVGKKVK